MPSPVQIAVDRPVPKASRAHRARQAAQDRPDPAFDQALSHAKSARPQGNAPKPTSPEPPAATEVSPEPAAEPKKVEQTSDSATAPRGDPSADATEAPVDKDMPAPSQAADASPPSPAAIGSELPVVTTPREVAEEAEQPEGPAPGRPVAIPETGPAMRPSTSAADAVTARSAVLADKSAAAVDAKAASSPKGATAEPEPIETAAPAKATRQAPQATTSAPAPAMDANRAAVGVASSTEPADVQLPAEAPTKEHRSRPQADTHSREQVASQAPASVTNPSLPAAHQAAPELPAVEVSMLAPQPHAPASPPSPAVVAQPLPITPQRFAETNHPQIVSAIRGELVPGGGTMHIRLDPPELGPLHVTVRMDDGVMTASFQTSSDQATQLLSHSLTQLKHVLESQGVTVEKLQVQQAPRDADARGSDDPRQQRQQDPDDHPARQEQQRRELLRRMWRRLAIGQDPLDLVA
jgi:flagellar hook-length control protein FliK